MESPAGKLSGWKAISDYLGGVSDDTLRRWAEENGLPIVRLGRGKTVIADPAEIDRWLAAHGWAMKQVQGQTLRPSDAVVSTMMPQQSFVVAELAASDRRRKDLHHGGMAAVLRRILPDHPWYVLLTSCLFAAYSVDSLMLETAYASKDFQRRAYSVAPLVFAGSLIGAVAVFHVLSRLIYRRVEYSLWAAIAIIVAVTAAIWIACLPVVPSYTVLEFFLPLGSAQFGHLKNLIHILLIVLFFVLPEYHHVLTIRRELRAGQKQLAKKLLGEKAPLLPSRSWLTAGLAIIVLLCLIGGSILISGIKQGPDHNRFVIFLLLRYVMQFALAVAGWGWYDSTLWKLRREFSSSGTRLATNP